MSQQSQQGDVLLFQTNDGGEIEVINGIVTMTPSFETAIYLSIFGGNDEDDGRAENEKTWWGNYLETDPAFKVISQTQNLLQGLPATSANLIRIEDAVKADLQWFLNLNIASSINVSVSIPDLNRIKIEGIIKAEGLETKFNFVENWRASK